MRKTISAVLVLCMVVSMLGLTAMAEGTYAPGTYEGAAQGMGGDVKVTITVDAEHITEAAVDVSMETPGYGADHQTDFEEQIKKADGAEIDGVTGCTITTGAVKKALEQALAAAKGETEAAQEAPRALEADVIVIGAGGAGLSAASSAVQGGASVIVLEVNEYAGGATITCGANFINIDPEQNAKEERNDAALEKYASYKAEDFPEQWQPNFAALTEEIAAYRESGTGAFDSVNRAIIDHFLAGDGYDLSGKRVSLNYDVIWGALEDNQEIKNWLVENGMQIKAGSSASSHYNQPVGKGSELIEVLLRAAEGADIQYGVRATELVVTDGRVTGVKAVTKDGEELEYRAAKGVVIATGGYTSNTAKVAEYQNQYTGMTAANPSNEPASIQGDGIWMAESIGAALNDMEFITTMLKGYNNLASSGEESTVYNAAQLAVNVNGVRFIDDKPASGPAAAVRYALNDQPEAIMYAVGDQKMIDAINANTEGLAEKLIERGIAWKADSVAEAAAAAGLDPEVLTATVETFNGYVDAGQDAEFGRTAFNGKVEDGPVYIVKLQSAYHLTFGGLTIDADTHVLDTEGKAIPGLFAAGDAVGNFEGDLHQSGFCITIVLWTGRTAGEVASAE